MLWPDRQEDIWKTEILDIIFHIVISSIPEELVPRIYLQTLREFAMYHLDQAWKITKSSLILDDKEIANVLELISTCAEMVDHNTPQIEHVYTITLKISILS